MTRLGMPTRSVVDCQSWTLSVQSTGGVPCLPAVSRWDIQISSTLSWNSHTRIRDQHLGVLQREIDITTAIVQLQREPDGDSAGNRRYPHLTAISSEDCWTRYSAGASRRSRLPPPDALRVSRVDGDAPAPASINGVHWCRCHNVAENRRCRRSTAEQEYDKQQGKCEARRRLAHVPILPLAANVFSPSALE
jgi:hypothetical protein